MTPRTERFYKREYASELLRIADFSPGCGPSSFGLGQTNARNGELMAIKI
jgi:hypothetical protein